ncbi:PTS glucose transporter subunit IIA [Allobaculum mucilyticum]|nr:PTS glucose transporter subunit IIA [Allobaculum mucilyticum]
MTGTMLPLTEIEDKVFSSGAMGQGFAIDPANGLVLAPCNAEVMMVFPTKHAIGLKTQRGEEVLVHLGMDTVELNGEAFTMLVKQGDLVTAGDPMVRMDLDAIRKAGKSTVSPVVVTSGQNVKLLASGNVEATTPAAVILSSTNI